MHPFARSARWARVTSLVLLVMVAGLLQPGAPPSEAAPAPIEPATPGRHERAAQLPPTEEAVVPPRLATPDRPPARVAGGDRIATAAALARTAFAGRPVPTALVVRADAYPDALSAAALAGAVDGPVLLTDTDRLPPATSAVLDELGVGETLVLGGSGAVGPQVEAALAESHTVRRLAGRDRYDTAALVAETTVARAGPVQRVIVASGATFADALAAGPLAASAVEPVLLTLPDALPAATADVVRRLRPVEVLVVGGAASIAEPVLADLRALGPQVRRIAGSDRVATSIALADEALARGLLDRDTTLLTRGDAFADALAAGAAGGALRAPLILTPGPTALGAAGGWLAGRCAEATAVTALGGPAALGADVLDEALRAARVCEAASVPVRLRVGVAALPSSGVGQDTFVAEVSAVLGDPAGWSQPEALVLAPSGGEVDLEVVLSAELEPACAAAGGCRDGDRLLVDAVGWSAPPPAWPDATTYHRWIVNHLLGHWLGFADAACEGPAAAADVMLDQHDGADGCTLGDRPTAQERRAVLARYRASVALAFGGDVHGEGVIATGLARGRNPLQPIAGLLSGADVAMVNLETPISTRGVPDAKTYTFRAPPALAPALAEAGVDVVSLANNHGLDYGVTAMLDTIAHAEAAGVRVVGAGRDAAEAYAPVVLERGGRRVAFLGLTRVLHTRAWEATATRPGLASAYDEGAAVAAVREAAAVADDVVVMVHWGQELATCPDGVQRRLADLLVDAGADVVVGAHPHVLQGVDRRPDALVAFSLGNFVWYHDRAPSRFTGVLTAELPLQASYGFEPAEIDGLGRPAPVSGALGGAIRADVAARSPGGGACG